MPCVPTFCTEQLLSTKFEGIVHTLKMLPRQSASNFDAAAGGSHESMSSSDESGAAASTAFAADSSQDTFSDADALMESTRRFRFITNLMLRESYSMEECMPETGR